MRTEQSHGNVGSLADFAHPSCLKLFLASLNANVRPWVCPKHNLGSSEVDNKLYELTMSSHLIDKYCSEWKARWRAHSEPDSDLSHLKASFFTSCKCCLYFRWRRIKDQGIQGRTFGGGLCWALKAEWNLRSLEQVVVYSWKDSKATEMALIDKAGEE